MPESVEKSSKGWPAPPGKTKGMAVAPARGKSGKKGLDGVGLGLGISSSSRKPLLQSGQMRSEEGEGVTETVRLHWWQKYWRGSPEVPSPPAEDMSTDKGEKRER